MFFILLIFTISGSVFAHTRQYVHTCLLSLDPYSKSNDAAHMIETASKCLARAYVPFPHQYKQPVFETLTTCIQQIREADRSAGEYRALEKSISSITSNLGSSIVEAQHLLENLVFCSQPLKTITAIEIYEQTRFDTVTDIFIHQLQKSDQCVEIGIKHIEETTADVDAKIKEFHTNYNTWTNMTLQRQMHSTNCRSQIETLTEEMTAVILRELTEN